MSNPHEPDLESRAKVTAFSCAGFTHEQVASYLEIDDKTLRKYYKNELEKSKMEKISAISNNVYKMALEGNEKMAEFVLKCQGRWSYAKSDEDKDKNTNSLLEKLIDKL